ncbi:MAG: PrsW family glutamic-type intramembrane protease [Acidobacteriota bacterium]
MKLWLDVTTGSLSGRRFETTNESLSLGRSPGCDLRFDENVDGMVSSHHAMVEAQGGLFVLVDQGSTNGTLVNGRKIDRAVLKSGDVVQLSAEGPRISVTIGDAALMPESQRTRIYDRPAPTRAVASDAPGAPPRPPRVPPPPPPPRAKPGGSTSNVKKALATIGSYDPDRERQKSGMGIAGALAAVALGGFLALIISFLVMMELGLGSFVVGSLLAFTPAPFYVLVFVWLDRFDPEPAWALAGAFFWGALFALLVSYILNSMFGIAVAIVAGGDNASAISAMLSAPPIEEGSKGLGLLLILVFLRREFDGVLDGLVYAGIVALGFATVENVLYYGRAFREGGLSGAMVLIVLRGILSPFAHALFTSMTGIGCGISRESHNPFLKFGAPIVGLFFAMTLHGIWNTVASLLEPYFLVIYFVVWVPLFIAFLLLIIGLSFRERRIVRKMLEIEVARGFLSPNDQQLSGSLVRRLAWLAGSGGSFGKLRARRKYLRAMVKLGFCYWHVSRASEAGHQTISLPMIPELQAEMKALRAQI